MENQEKMQDFLEEEQKKQEGDLSTKEEKEKPKCNHKTWLWVLLSILLTAGIVGGGTCYFSKKYFENKKNIAVEELKKESEEGKRELENKTKELEMKLEDATGLIEKLEIMSDQATIILCEEEYQIQNKSIENVNVGSLLEKASEEENSTICENFSIGGFKESTIGVSLKAESEDSYLISFFHNDNEVEKVDPFNLSPFIFKVDFKRNEFLYKNQFDGSFYYLVSIN